MLARKVETSTVKGYLAGLPPERRSALEAVRRVIRKNLPRGFEEGMQYGSIGYYVPFSRLAHTYNGEPLALACLASQKGHMALYLMSIYGSVELRTWFEREYKKSGKKLDMGKACIRFKSLDDLPLDLVGKAIAAVSVDDYVAVYESSRLATRGVSRGRKATRKPTGKTARTAKTARSARSAAKVTRRVAATAKGKTKAKAGRAAR